ncbi:MFS transporter [Marinicella litoralis]|uniref:Putative MFS family arabinose efflux permease n=1 Tax=Marinicella litoralis TaxID=644220 RepID=A0A4R6XIY5_9GAMM|nr:MFS transporter [Marinicella litoralis]TDR19455.1 putative MFS family arabinose efflux permease [Marinicella litoralis]
MYQLLMIFIALLLISFLINRFSGLHKNISILFLTQPLITAAAPMMVFIGGIISKQMAPSPSLVTLPLSFMIAGTAVATIPAAFLAKKLGRRKATMLGFCSGIVGGLLAVLAIKTALFYLFVTAAFVMGFSGSFAQQLRFAAIESLADQKDIPKAVSLLMLTGIFAALIGPELAFVSKDWMAASQDYTGTFFGIMILAAIAITIVSRFKAPELAEDVISQPTRSMTEIAKQPVFIVAMVAAALGFGLMSFVMTATPLSMHQLHNHSLEHTKWVIQSHVAAMYLPSLLTIWLGSRIKTKYFLLVGTLMFIGVVVIASQGHELLHYWWALILLGIGWNFLFYAGTTLLPLSYHNHERHKVQGINDFSIFTFQGLSSLMAGWVLFNYQWQGILYTCIPFLAIMLAITMMRFINTHKDATAH